MTPKNKPSTSAPSLGQTVVMTDWRETKKWSDHPWKRGEGRIKSRPVTECNDYAERVKEYEAIWNLRGSVKQRERDVVMGGLGVAQQYAEGDIPIMDAGQEAWLQTFTHLQYGIGFKVTQIAQEDELYGVYGRFSSEAARSMVYTQEISAMSTFNNLSATAYTAGGSNFTLLSTAQYRVDDGTWSNKLASGADLSIESLELLLTQWRTGMLDLRGRKIATEPRVLMVGPTDRWVAERIVNSTQRPFTANNDTNTIRSLGLQVAVMTHMNDDGRWFLLGEKEQTGLQWSRSGHILQ